MGVKVAILFPHQLYRENPLLGEGIDRVYLVEDPLFFQQYPFHVQKLMLHRASMKWKEESLKRQGVPVRYVEAREGGDSSHLAEVLSNEGVSQAIALDPSDDWLQRRVEAGCRQNKVELHWLADPHWLASDVDFADVFGDRKKLFFTEFYIHQRKRLGYLLEEDGRPLGGNWSYDQENRKKLPKGLAIPTTLQLFEDSIGKEAQSYVQTRFPNAVGDRGPLHFPYSPDLAKRWLKRFLDERFEFFGPYEDAIDREGDILFHSALSPMINIGILTAKEVVEEAIQVFLELPEDKQSGTWLASTEGFVRQIIGWREYIHGVYRKYGRRERSSNAWGHHNAMPASFYDGTTGVEPVDRVLRRVIQLGYCHHIERLMILGNFMFLCEIKPDEVYRWFMEHFVDAYDWVMVPNIYGMSQNADGGMITTKPYVSGSNYVLKMSNFSKGEWGTIWDALYWTFIDKHQELFAKNPRMSMMVSQLRKMGDKLEGHRKMAARFREQLFR